MRMVSKFTNMKKNSIIYHFKKSGDAKYVLKIALFPRFTVIMHVIVIVICFIATEFVFEGYSMLCTNEPTVFTVICMSGFRAKFTYACIFRMCVENII